MRAGTGEQEFEKLRLPDKLCLNLQVVESFLHDVLGRVGTAFEEVGEGVGVRGNLAGPLVFDVERARCKLLPDGTSLLLLKLRTAFTGSWSAEPISQHSGSQRYPSSLSTYK